MAEGLKNPVVCREDRIASLIPLQLLDVREAIRAALSTIAEHGVETNWSMAGPIPGDPDWAGGTVFRDTRELVVDAPAWAVFRAMWHVGGGHRWYAAKWLWRLRGWIDRLVGGPGSFEDAVIRRWSATTKRWTSDGWGTTNGTTGWHYALK